MRFVLSEDQLSLTEKNFKKSLSQQVGMRILTSFQMIFSNWFPHHGLHRLLRQAHPYPDQQYYCRIICCHIINMILGVSFIVIVQSIKLSWIDNMYFIIYIFKIFYNTNVEGIGKYLLDVFLKQKIKYWNDDNVQFAVWFRLLIE